jgi:hypothetical protein
VDRVASYWVGIWRDRGDGLPSWSAGASGLLSEHRLPTQQEWDLERESRTLSASRRATLTSAHLAIDGTEAEALSKLDAQFGALFRTEDFKEGRKADSCIDPDRFACFMAKKAETRGPFVLVRCSVDRQVGSDSMVI